MGDIQVLGDIEVDSGVLGDILVVEQEDSLKLEEGIRWPAKGKVLNMRLLSNIPVADIRQWDTDVHAEVGLKLAAGGKCWSLEVEGWHHWRCEGERPRTSSSRSPWQDDYDDEGVLDQDGELLDHLDSFHIWSTKATKARVCFLFKPWILNCDNRLLGFSKCQPSNF